MESYEESKNIPTLNEIINQECKRNKLIIEQPEAPVWFKILFVIYFLSFLLFFWGDLINYI